MKRRLSEMEAESPNMEKVTENMLFLKKSLMLTEKERKDFICKELQRIFPGSFGKVISPKLSYFLHDIALDDMDKQNAWLQMGAKLDQCPNLSFDQKFEDYIESENVNWDKIEQIYIDKMEKFNGLKIQNIVEGMWDLSDYHLTDEEMKWYEIGFHFLQSNENIEHLHDVFLRNNRIL